jgi:capsular polysaccharide biosynthesis protein
MNSLNGDNNSSDHFKLEMAQTPHSFVGYGENVPFKEVSREEIFVSPPQDIPNIHVIEENIRINWGARVRYDLCFGSGLETFKNLHLNPTYNTGSYYLASFRDVTVDLKTGFLIYSRTKAWADSCFATIQHGPVQYSPAVEARGDERWFSPGKAAAKALGIDDPVMILCHWGSLVNYGHWLANSLLSAFLVVPELRSGRLSLLCPPLSDRQKRELSMIGVPNERIIETGEQYIKASHVIYPSPVSTISNIAPAPVCMDLFQALKNSAAQRPDQPAPEYVYVSRLGASHSRSMRNESALIEALSGLGMTAIFPHNLSFDAQIKAFSRARVIVGQLGAALWSILFAPPGGAFLEISTSNYASYEYVAIANLMDRDIVQIMIDPSQDGYLNDVVFDFDSPIDHVVNVARTLISEDRSELIPRKPYHSSLRP